jgi:hypothetical protein
MSQFTSGLRIKAGKNYHSDEWWKIRRPGIIDDFERDVWRVQEYTKVKGYENYRYGTCWSDTCDCQAAYRR